MTRRVLAVIGALAVLAAAAVAVPRLLDNGDADASAATASSVTTKRVTAVREPDPATLGAVATVPSVPLYDDATTTTSSFALPNPTHEGVPLTFAIEAREGDRYFVRLPMRPNGSKAWIDVDQVKAHVVDKHIVVDISDRRLTLFRGERKLMDEPVAVGSDATPTPLGDFYIDISIPDPGGPYGDHMLSVAGFSDVLTDFGGGIGQIAIHGWSDPSVMGQAVSNGCVRLPNGVITHLADLTSVGTPVHIQA